MIYLGKTIDLTICLAEIIQLPIIQTFAAIRELKIEKLAGIYPGLGSIINYTPSFLYISVRIIATVLHIETIHSN